MRSLTLRWLAMSLLLLALLPACEATSSPPPVPTTTAPPPPDVRFTAPPETLCRDATQLRLRPTVVGLWPEEMAARWSLIAVNDEEPLTSGQWTPETGELFVAFPGGVTLPPGEYLLRLETEDLQVGHHNFTVLDAAPQLTETNVALSPDGPPIEAAEDLPYVFYIRYGFEAVCPGSPLWISVSSEGEPVCREKVTLAEERGSDVIACYREDGKSMAAGEYEAILTLMGEEAGSLTFRLGPEPVEPVVYNPVCTVPFTAMGLSPEGEPFRNLSRFEWYTQAIYVGTQCRDLPPEIAWEARWYRNGEEIRLHEGHRMGSGQGVIWDSLTGTENSPFLPPGAYTVTLTIADVDPLQTAFDVIPYIPPATVTPNPQ